MYCIPYRRFAVLLFEIQTTYHAVAIYTAMNNHVRTGTLVPRSESHLGLAATFLYIIPPQSRFSRLVPNSRLPLFAINETSGRQRNYRKAPVLVWSQPYQVRKFTDCAFRSNRTRFQFPTPTTPNSHTKQLMAPLTLIGLPLLETTKVRTGRLAPNVDPAHRTQLAI